MHRIAIAGNPNAGKTSLFNAITRTVQQVSNYPGVTVEKKIGEALVGGEPTEIVDLPGTYSLTAYSQEEVVARNYIIEDKPELVIDVVDASNLERNLYLTIQIMEMHVPMVIALNMVDVAEKRGLIIDPEALSQLLGVPVIATVGNKAKGIAPLLEACTKVLKEPQSAIPRPVTYGHEVNREIDNLEQYISGVASFKDLFHPRWLAVKLIEGDEEVEKRLKHLENADRVFEQAKNTAQKIEFHYKESASTIIAERRYGYAAGAVKKSLSLSGEARQNVTDEIDTIVCNRILGPVVLVAVVAALFFWVFKISDEWAWIPWFGGWVSPTGLMEWIFESLSTIIEPMSETMPMLHSLLNDGIIGGVGGVMGFVPLIFFMFMFISALEDTGYIARVAFILDRVLHIFGLQGKSILAMIVSGGLGAGGCAVPGVMATRTLREDKDRLVTMLVAPFMNCGAKMPVYAMLIAAFFTHHRTEMMILLWAISWVVALCAAWCLRRFVIRGEQTPFVMELPPYHVPVLRSVLRHTWERTWMYMKKAGTIILVINILLWALMYFPQVPEEKVASLSPDKAAAETLAHSYAGRIGKSLEPLSRHAGFDWRTNIALIGGFAAKEVVVGTLGTVYSMGDVHPEKSESLSERLRGDDTWNPLRAFTLMIFVMIYAPCFVTITMIKRESGSWKWALFSTVYSTTAAFLLATLIYQAGILFGFQV